MQDNFRYTAELSANVTDPSSEKSEHAICIRMLDPDATNHRHSHVGVIISPEIAREFAHWLLEAADSSDEFTIVDPPE